MTTEIVPIEKNEETNIAVSIDLNEKIFPLKDPSSPTSFSSSTTTTMNNNTTTTIPSSPKNIKNKQLETLSEQQILSLSLEEPNSPSGHSKILPTIHDNDSTCFRWYHFFIEHEQIQRILLLASVVFATFDVATDISVCYSYYSNERKVVFGALLTFFLVFTNIMSLLYHIGEHVERSTDRTSVAPANSQQTSTDNNNNTSENTDDSAIVTVTPYKMSHVPWWHIPLYLSGLGVLAAAIECFKRGKRDQAYEETRYFEVLMEDIPSGALQLYVLVTDDLTNTPIIEIISVIASVMSVGIGTWDYFARGYDKGNILEMTPVIVRWDVGIFMWISTTTDYIVRVVSLYVLITAEDLGGSMSFLKYVLPIFLIVFEIYCIYKIHGDFKTFAGPYGWLAGFTSSVAYFAAVGTRFQAVNALWLEFLLRSTINITMAGLGFFAFGFAKGYGDHLYRFHFDFWLYLWISCFVISSICYPLMVWESKTFLSQMNLPPLEGKLGTRNFKKLYLTIKDLNLSEKNFTPRQTSYYLGASHKPINNNERYFE